MNFHFVLLSDYDFFPFLDLDSLFSLILQKIMIFFPFRILIVFFFTTFQNIMILFPFQILIAVVVVVVFYFLKTFLLHLSTVTKAQYIYSPSTGLYVSLHLVWKASEETLLQRLYLFGIGNPFSQCLHSWWNPIDSVN